MLKPFSQAIAMNITQLLILLLQLTTTLRLSNLSESATANLDLNTAEEVHHSHIIEEKEL